MRRRVLFFLLLFFLLSSFIGGSVFSTYSLFMAEGPLQTQRNIYIPKGKSLKEIAKYLKREGVINSASIFSIGVRAHRKSGSIQSGEYIIPPKVSASFVMDILTKGQTVVRKITITEGLTSEEVVDFLNNEPNLEGKITDIPKEGALLPETYYYSLFDDRESVLNRMKDSMQTLLKDLWEKRDKNFPLKTLEEALTMASIVEKESSVDYERSFIASVFFNRIKKGMRLQSDPTVLFAIKRGEDKTKKRLYYKDLKYKSPYNTYLVYGLPPHPICNPSKASLEAVFHPEKTKYLYFVADGSGAHVFAKTLAEHNKNVLAWRKVRKNRKEMQRRFRARLKREAIPRPGPLSVYKKENGDILLP